jgi:hypothetical protein
MALESNQSLISVAAAADLSAKQFYAVTIGSGGTIDVSTAAKNCDGILQDKPTSGKVGTVQYDGITKAAISASSNVAIGGLLEVDTGGTLKAIASGTAIAKALQATNTGTVTIITVRLLRSNAVYS